MRGIWFGLTTASFVAATYINAGSTSALAVFGVACAFGLLYEVVNS